MAGNWVLALNIVLVVLVLVLIASQWAGFQFIRSRWTCQANSQAQDQTAVPMINKSNTSTSNQTTFAWSEIVKEAEKIISSDAYKSLSGKTKAICQQLSAMNDQMASGQVADTIKTASIILETEYDQALEEIKYLLSLQAT